MQASTEAMPEASSQRRRAKKTKAASLREYHTHGGEAIAVKDGNRVEVFGDARYEILPSATTTAFLELTAPGARHPAPGTEFAPDRGATKHGLQKCRKISLCAHHATSFRVAMLDQRTHLASSQGMQLSIAKDHSPTNTGSTAQVWYRNMDVYEHDILSWTYIFCLRNGFKAAQANEIECQAKPSERPRRGEKNLD